jgi:hypothetical protein
MALMSPHSAKLADKAMFSGSSSKWLILNLAATILMPSALAPLLRGAGASVFVTQVKVR